MLYDNRGQPDAAVDEDAAIERRLDLILVWKTRSALPLGIDSEFDAH